MTSPLEGDAYGLRWSNGVGTLPGSSLKFRLNEFGMLEVIRDAGETNLAAVQLQSTVNPLTIISSAPMRGTIPQQMALRDSLSRPAHMNTRNSQNSIATSYIYAPANNVDATQSLYSPAYTQIAQQMPNLTPYSYVPLTQTVPQVPVVQTHGYHSAPLTLHVTGGGGVEIEPAQYAELQPRAPSPANMYAPKLGSQQASTSTSTLPTTNIAKPPKPRAPRSPRAKKPKTNGETAPPSISAPLITSPPPTRPVPNSTSSIAKPASKQVLTSSNTHIVIQTGNGSQPVAPTAVTTLGNTTVALRTSTSNYRCMGCGKTYPIGQSVDARGEYCSPHCQQNPKPPPPPLSPGKRRGRPPRSGPPQPKPGKPTKSPSTAATNNVSVQRIAPTSSGPHPLSRPGARIAKSVTSLTWNIDEYLSKQSAIEAPEALFPHVQNAKKAMGASWKRNPLQIGMMLEGVDPRNQSLFCVLSVSEVRGHRVRLHLEGYSPSFDFWMSYYSPFIFPVGWCAQHSKILQPPKGVTGEFRWDVYLRQKRAVAAPATTFFMTSVLPPESKSSSAVEGIEVGMKLEITDRANPDSFRVASIIDIVGTFLLIHVDDSNEFSSYWIEYNSPRLRPVGYSRAHGITLIPPSSWNSGDPFDWEQYLLKMNAKPLTSAILQQRQAIHFEVGMRLAAVDRRCPALVRAATVSGVQNYRVKLHFDGWNAAYDYQVEDTSLDIFPFDFLLETGHDIEPPLDLLANCKASKSCPQPGCYGHGHIQGALYSSHSNVNQCPYAPQNMHKEPPGTMRQVEKLISRPSLSSAPQPSQPPSFAVNVSMAKTPTSVTHAPRIPSKPNISARGRGRPATMNARTNSVSPKSQAPSPAANRTSGVQVSRLQPNEATKTALTGELAQRIFEAMLPLMQSKEEPSSPSPSRTGRGRPPKQKPESENAAILLKKAESIAMSLLNNNRSNASSPASSKQPNKPSITANKPSSIKPSSNKPAANKTAPNKPNSKPTKTPPKTTGAAASKRQAIKHSASENSSSEEELHEKAASVSDDEDFSPVAKRRRSREDVDWTPKVIAPAVGSSRTRSNYNLKSRSSASVGYMVMESDSESELMRSIEDLEEESPRSAPNERSRSLPAAYDSPLAGKRPRGRPRKDSAGTSPASSSSASVTYTRTTQSSSSGRPRRGRPPRTVPQSALAAKRITRLAAGQTRFPSKKASLGSTRTSKQEPVDQMLLSLGLKKVAAPASGGKASSSAVNLPIEKLRAIAFDLFFASTPDPQSVSLVLSLLPPGVDQLTPEKSSISKEPISKAKEIQISVTENTKEVPEIHELGLRESLLREILTDAANVHHWNVVRVSELVTDILLDVGADDATVASVRLGFARDAIDGWALTRLNQQELSQRFGLPFGLALRLSSIISHLCTASMSRQSEPSPLPDTTAASCETSEALAASSAVSAADMKLEEPAADAADEKSVPSGVELVDDTEPDPSDEPNPTAVCEPTPTELTEVSAIPTEPSQSETMDLLVASNPTASDESESVQQNSPVPIDST